MNLLEACELARKGNFISHKSFDCKQSMHEYMYDLYYEDGANLSCDNFIEALENFPWTKEGWYVKYPKEKVDREKLKTLHENSKGYMLKNNQSYEDCIIP